MIEHKILEIIVFLGIILLLVKPLGQFMATVYEGGQNFLSPIIGPMERAFYKLMGIDVDHEMSWKEYAISMIALSCLGSLLLYLIQRIQEFLPFNPQSFSAVSPDLAFNTAVSFVTNSDWQAYSGENSLSYLTQMLGLTVQNFLSAAMGMSVLVALIRGLKRREMVTLGNFWIDTTRGILYILLPLSILLACILVSQGVIQNFKEYQTANLIQPVQYQETNDATVKFQTQQTLPMGPVASQVAIKQLGTNGGGFFNVNSAHPFENPTPFSNFLEMLAILLIPAALCYTFGVMVGDKRQGWAILAAMFIIFLPLLYIVDGLEHGGNRALAGLSLGPNMEGKETRFGILNSALWSTVTTATGNGSVNAMIDSFVPLAGLIPLLLIDLGEVIFGGVGSGLYQMLILVIITVFISGLMVGRTPEYLGKKIESYEMKMSSFIFLIMPLVVLFCSALAVVTEAGKSSMGNPGAHGFTEVLYAFSSMTNNNGSAFAGLNANSFFYNLLGGLAILMGRFWIAIPVLAIAGSLVRKKIVPVSAGTLPTHTPLFVIVLVCVILIFGALTFFPAFSLGPIVESLMLQENLFSGM